MCIYRKLACLPVKVSVPSSGRYCNSVFCKSIGEVGSTRMLQLTFLQGLARTQTPTLINCVPELPTFGVIAGVNPTEVQWKGLFLREPPFFVFHKSINWPIYNKNRWGVNSPTRPAPSKKLQFIEPYKDLLTLHIEIENKN